MLPVYKYSAETVCYTKTARKKGYDRRHGTQNGLRRRNQYGFYVHKMRFTVD
jgi:hypothetical protein